MESYILPCHEPPHCHLVVGATTTYQYSHILLMDFIYNPRVWTHLEGHGSISDMQPSLFTGSSTTANVMSPIYRTRSIIGSDLVKNRTRCWGLTSWQTPCSIFIYSSPSVSQHRPCPSYPSHSQHSMASLVPPCLLVLSDPPRSSSVVDGGFFSEFELWSTALIMIDLAFTPPAHLWGLNECGKTH